MWVATRDDKRFALKIVPYSSGALVCHEYEISRKLRQYRFIVYVHEAWLFFIFIFRHFLINFLGLKTLFFIFLPNYVKKTFSKLLVIM